jgi:hypothetical protein
VRREGQVDMEADRQLLRHTLATLSYRAAKTLRGAPPEFAAYQSPDGSKPPGKILAHMGDLIDWGLSMADGSRKWKDSEPLAWDQECARFFAAMKALDDYLASGVELQAPLEKLFQGPIADALTHTGQLATLRRMSGAPMKGENYYAADIAAGRVGPEQTPPKREF